MELFRRQISKALGFKVLGLLGFSQKVALGLRFWVFMGNYTWQHH